MIDETAVKALKRTCVRVLVLRQRCSPYSTPAPAPSLAVTSTSAHHLPALSESIRIGPTAEIRGEPLHESVATRKVRAFDRSEEPDGIASVAVGVN